jgi:putative transposase
MPRRPRLDLPGVPEHLVQRGNDRSSCFRDDSDRRDYLRILTDRSQQFGVAVHAYVLMNNHVHLLVTAECVGATSRMMQISGATYARHFNDRHGRTGTLWEGRFHSCPIDSGSYLWNCHRYIELNPVRAGIVATPDAYRWSSFAGNALGQFDRLLTPRAEYIALSPSAPDRSRAYRALFESALGAAERDEIRRHLIHERPWGGPAFLDEIERRAGFSQSIRPPGRPRIRTDA